MSDNCEKFRAADVEALWFDDTERHQSVMRECIEPVVFRTRDGQNLSGLHLNRDFSQLPTIVRIGAWLHSVNSAEQKYTAYQLAATNPENPIVLVDMPAHGNSDALTYNQKKEVFCRQSISRIASDQADAVSAFMDHNGIVLAADSLGGLASLDFARRMKQNGEDPQLIAAYDIVGFDKKLSISMAKKFLVNERKLQGRYHCGEHNQRLDTSYEDNFIGELKRSGCEPQYDQLDVYRKDPSLALLLFARSPVASSKGYKALERSLEVSPDMKVNLVFAGLSRVSRWQKIQPQIQSLLRKYSDRLTVEVWPDDSHSMSIAPQQPRFAQHLRALMTS